MDNENCDASSFPNSLFSTFMPRNTFILIIFRLLEISVQISTYLSVLSYSDWDSVQSIAVTL